MWNAIYDRRKGIAKATGTMGVLYLASKFISQRLNDMRQTVVQERTARESLRRRYQQTQEDISFTVMALLPSLAEQIQATMDVERITAELQALSNPKSSSSIAPHSARQSPQASEFLLPRQSFINREADASETRSDTAETESVASTSNSQYDGESSMSGSMLAESTTSSWVERLSVSASSPVDVPPSPVAGVTSLSDSITSAGSMLTSEPPLSDSMLSNNPSKSKAELWKELKILSISRALTTSYAITLLTLLTSVQLTQLARRRYVSAVRTLEREERSGSSFDLMSILLGGLPEFSLDESSDELDDDADVDQPTENMFLTLSWWVLHVGWKDLSEVITKAVRDVFMGVSLKTRLTAADIVRLFRDVRREVEWDGGRRSRMAHFLIPTTRETAQAVLVQGGILHPSAIGRSNADVDDLLASGAHSSQPLCKEIFALPASQAAALPSAFTSLYSEIQLIFSSPEFDGVLETSLECSVQFLTEEVGALFYQVEHVNLDAEMRLAELLPGLSQWSQAVLNALPNRLIDRLLALPEMGNLSAIIFGRFQDSLS